MHGVVGNDGPRGSILSRRPGNQVNQPPGNALSLSHHSLLVAFTARKHVAQTLHHHQLSLVGLSKCIVVPGMKKTNGFGLCCKVFQHSFFLSQIFYFKKCIFFPFFLGQ